MGTLVPATTPVSFSTIQSYLGGSSPISLSEYYAGGEYVPSVGNSVPSSGTISINSLLGIETRYTVITAFTSSGSFTVPAGVTRIFVVVVGGGGGGGGNKYTIAGDSTFTLYARGGSGGFGGIAMAFQNVTPGTVLTATVGARGSAGVGADFYTTGYASSGGTGGSSVFNGLTATGGSGGVGAYSSGSGDTPYTASPGAAGAGGTSSGTNYVGSALLGTNVSSASWVTYYDGLIGRFVGASNSSNRTSLTTIRNQTATLATNTSWSSIGAIRPGPGAPTTSGQFSAAGGPGAVLIYY